MIDLLVWVHGIRGIWGRRSEDLPDEEVFEPACLELQVYGIWRSYETQNGYN